MDLLNSTDAWKKIRKADRYAERGAFDAFDFDKDELMGWVNHFHYDLRPLMLGLDDAADGAVVGYDYISEMICRFIIMVDGRIVIEAFFDSETLLAAVRVYRHFDGGVSVYKAALDWEDEWMASDGITLEEAVRAAYFGHC